MQHVEFVILSFLRDILIKSFYKYCRTMMGPSKMDKGWIIHRTAGTSLQESPPSLSSWSRLQHTFGSHNIYVSSLCWAWANDALLPYALLLGRFSCFVFSRCHWEHSPAVRLRSNDTKRINEAHSCMTFGYRMHDDRL